MSEKRGRTLYFTCIKIFAMLLVTYGHFISVGTYSVEIPGVISGIMNEPLMPGTTQMLWKIESWAYRVLHIEFSVVGVVLFFLVSGYFIPALQEKYNKTYLREKRNLPSLLFTRLSRLYPTLILCVFLNGVLVYVAQGIRFSPIDYVGTGLLLVRVLPIQPTMDVIWYLLILCFVYFIATVVPKFTVINLTYIYAFLLLMVLIPYMIGDSPVTWMAWNMEYLSKYAGIILLGSYVSLSETFSSKLYRTIGFLWYFMLTMAVLKIDETIYQSTSTYSEICTYLAAFMIIVVIRCVCGLVGDHLKGIVVKTLFSVEKISLAFYLLHVHFGLTTIFYLKQLGVNAYLNVLCAYMISAIVAIVVTWLVGRIEQTVWYKKIGVDWIS